MTMTRNAVRLCTAPCPGPIPSELKHMHGPCSRAEEARSPSALKLRARLSCVACRTLFGPARLLQEAHGSTRPQLPQGQGQGAMSLLQQSCWAG